MMLLVVSYKEYRRYGEGERLTTATSDCVQVQAS